MRNDKRLKKKNVIALDIGTKTTKIAVGKFNSGKISTKKLMTLDMPDACVSNGRITNHNKLALILKDFIKKEGIKEKYVIVNIKSSSIINRELTIPFNDNPKELEQVIQYEMKQFTAIHMEEYMTQHQVIDVFYEDKVKMNRVLVTSIKKEIVEGYLKLIKEMGLKPYVMDVHFNAIRKFFETHDEVNAEAKTIAVVDFGFDGTDVTILENGKYRMSRTIDRGYNTLEKLFKNELEIDFTEKAIEDLFAAEDVELKSVVEGFLDYTVSEIDDIIRYHISRDSKNRVDHIFITGDMIRVTPIIKYIEERIGLSPFKMDSSEKITMGFKDEINLPMYINVLGSLVRK